MRILADPDYISSNPYPSLLYGELKGLGCHVERYTVRKAMLKKWDVIHFHWPQIAAPSHGAAKFWTKKAVEKIAALPKARAQGAKIFWTVHNLHRHDHNPSALERADWSAFLRLCDATLHLSQSGREIAFEALPGLRERPSFVTPHGAYPDALALTQSRSEARSAVGLPQGKKIIAYFGMIRPYKNVGELLTAFLDIPQPHDYHLVIAGKVHASAAGMEQQFRELVGHRSDVTLQLEFLSETTLGNLARAADLCVFPYREIFNSGSLYYALSAGRAALSPRSPVFSELSNAVGEQWVQLFEPPLTGNVLAQALGKAALCADQRPDLEAISWNNIAKQTLDAYQSVCR